ncbi:hypothetical protein ACOME3_010603 [Neoechinorhynchus agilis]
MHRRITTNETINQHLVGGSSDPSVVTSPRYTPQQLAYFKLGQRSIERTQEHLPGLEVTNQKLYGGYVPPSNNRQNKESSSYYENRIYNSGTVIDSSLVDPLDRSFRAIRMVSPTNNQTSTDNNMQLTRTAAAAAAADSVTYRTYRPSNHRFQQGSSNTNTTSNLYGPGYVMNTQVNDSTNDSQLSRTNLYIKGLPKEFDDAELARLCQGAGRIRSLKAILDKDTNKCKGYGFVDFETPEAADFAMQRINRLTNFHAQKAKQQEQDPTNLYFANLSPTVTEVILESVLSRYGNVISTRILRDNGSRSKGVGFARMETRDICEQVIQELNGKQHQQLGDSELLVKLADGSKKPRQSHQRSSFGTNQVQPNAAQVAAAAAASANYYAEHAQNLAAGLGATYMQYRPDVQPPTLTTHPTTLFATTPPTNNPQDYLNANHAAAAAAAATPICYLASPGGQLTHAFAQLHIGSPPNLQAAQQQPQMPFATQAAVAAAAYSTNGFFNTFPYFNHSSSPHSPPTGAFVPSILATYDGITALNPYIMAPTANGNLGAASSHYSTVSSDANVNEFGEEQCDDDNGYEYPAYESSSASSVTISTANNPVVSGSNEEFFPVEPDENVQNDGTDEPAANLDLTPSVQQNIEPVEPDNVTK